MTRWTKAHRDSEERSAMLSQLMDFMKQGKLKAPNHSLVSLEQYKVALEAMNKPSGFTGVKYIIDFRK